MKKFINKIKKTCKNFMTGKSGFSLVELIVVIAIMAVMAAVLAPALLGYVEKSRMQKDDSAMDEVVNAVQLSLADQSIYDEVLEHSVWDNVSCYIDKKDESQFADCKVQLKAANGDKKEQYMFGDEARLLDETVYYAAGNMRGLTITFSPSESGDTYDFANGILNKFVGRKTGLLSENPELYNRLRSVIGDKLDTTSQTYRNSDYTIFIRVGSTGGSEAVMQDAVQVWGQFNGTNLSEKDHKFELSSGRVVGTAGQNDASNNQANNENSDIDFSETQSYSEFSGLFIARNGQRAKITVDGQTVDATWENLLKGNYLQVNNGVLSNGANVSQLSGVLVVDRSVRSIPQRSYGAQNSFLRGSSITEIIFEEGLESIGYTAIQVIPSLKRIELPASLEEISGSSIIQCVNLEEITVSSNSEYLKNVNGILLSKDGKTLYKIPMYLKNTELTIPEGIETIASLAGHWTNATKITLPTTLLSVGGQAFEHNNDLVDFVINSNCTFGNAVWRNNKNVNIILNNNNRYVYENNMLLSKDGKQLYFAAFNTGTLIVPLGVKEIMPCAIASTHMETLVLPSTLNKIGKSNTMLRLKNIKYQGTEDAFTKIQLEQSDSADWDEWKAASKTYNYSY